MRICISTVTAAFKQRKASSSGAELSLGDSRRAAGTKLAEQQGKGVSRMEGDGKSTYSIVHKRGERSPRRPPLFRLAHTYRSVHGRLACAGPGDDAHALGEMEQRALAVHRGARLK